MKVFFACLLLLFAVNAHPYGKGILNNRCTQRAVKEQIKFSHPSDRKKYIICKAVNKHSIRNCQDEKYFNSSQQVCTASTIITTQRPLITPVITTPKPQCPIQVWDNQNEVGTALPAFYSNPCNADPTRVCDYIYVNYMIDNHKFIRCDRLGKSLVKTCPTSSNWDTALNKCTASTIITTPKPQCPIPVWDNQNEVGTALPDFYPNPCKVDSARACTFIYVQYIIDNHKLIRCDKLGNALVKTCPITSNWDTELKECTNVDIITTTPKPQCPIPVWDNPSEVGTELPDFYPNPCKFDSARACDFIYVNDIIDNHKFIRCDKLGKALVKTCPISSNWDTELKECANVDIITTTPKPQCPIPLWDNQNEVGIALPDFYPNPCKVDSARTCDFIYVDYMIDNHKFIRCGKSGNALLKTCPISSNWDTALNKCATVDIITTTPVITTTPKPQCPILVWDNPKEEGTALPEFYANPCKIDSARACDFIYVNDIIDNHKFIRCDKLGNALVKTCPISLNWDTALNKCTASTITTTQRPLITPVITTPKPQCHIPLWDNQNEVGTALPDLYPNPCKVDSARACDFIYVNDIIDNHKFIRCDKLGNALVKTCPISSNWDTESNKCATVVTTTPVITTPKPQCSIPVWDDQNEVGRALPEFYANPCKVDLARACNYIYVKYIIEISANIIINDRFIRCDKLGNALVKTCPTFVNWDTGLNKCATVDIITTTPVITTTPKLQCPIPVWDNPSEVGTALPDFYPNPCKVDSARACDFIYVNDIIDNHKFIRCDKLGNALVKTCPISSNWDTALNKCENVVMKITTPVITTTPKPQCPIPIWDNPSEAGTTLPGFYANPCNADSTRACKYIYVDYVLDDHKFIRCDRLGNALKKTCPSSSNWDNELKECTAST